MSVERLSAEDKLVRKLRKKLRQIEHLETSGRSLNEEESIKVNPLCELARQTLTSQIILNIPAIGKKQRVHSSWTCPAFEFLRKSSLSANSSDYWRLNHKYCNSEWDFLIVIFPIEIPLNCPENVKGSQVNSEIPCFQKEEQTVTLVHDEAINMKRASTPTE